MGRARPSPGPGGPAEVASDHRTQDVTVWTKALNRIALFGDATVEPGLLRALADTGHRGVRWSALACAELGFRRAVPLITALLEHPDPMVREGACEALGLLEEHAAVPALAARLNDETTWVRSRAALALGQIGGDRALPALEHLAAHDLARTTLGGLVATAAKQGLRTAHRIRARTAST